MARKTNYGFERREREKARALKKADRQRAKQECRTVKFFACNSGIPRFTLRLLMRPDARAGAQKPQTKTPHKDQITAIRWQHISLSKGARVLAR